jgi:hypothetical protein
MLGPIMSEKMYLVPAFTKYHRIEYHVTIDAYLARYYDLVYILGKQGCRPTSERSDPNCTYQ